MKESYRKGATVLNQIYEEDFLGFSYGFRPGRSAHDALDALTAAIMTKVDRKTVGKRMTGKLRDIAAKLRERRHAPIAPTGNWLNQVVRGYSNYHAVPGNLRRLYAFRRAIARHWLFMLRRRSQRSRWTWERFEKLVNRYLPWPKVLHPYPLDRFCAKYPR
jgi:hypothetical protein